MPPPRPTRIALLLAATAAGAACTDADLYQQRTIPYRPDRVAVSARVCTDDVRRSDFPVKVLFLVDVSQSLRSPRNDPAMRRAKAIDDILALWGRNPAFHFGIAIFGSRAANLLTDASGRKPLGFTRDLSRLQAAVGVLRSGGGAYATVGQCRGGRCRDLRAALSLANSIVSGDILSATPGARARTTYAVVLIAGGPPVPALDRCACRDKKDEQKGGRWAGCPFAECDGCQVTCPAGARCSGSTCTVGTRTVPAVKPTPTLVPDTFSFGVPPPVRGKCQRLRCILGAGGNVSSCEEKVLLKDVLELTSFARKSGAGRVQLNVFYLPDLEAVTSGTYAGKKSSRAPGDPFRPQGVCGNLDLQADQARAARVLGQMAYTGGGGFTRLASADQLPAAVATLGRTLYASREPLVFKELVVSNLNALPGGGAHLPDSDADGLSDATEKRLGTCPTDRDSDGDGVGDGVEVTIARDPRTAGRPTECLDLTATRTTGPDPCRRGATRTWTRYADRDRDGLSACEERLLGTDDSLFDSDRDGIADRVELALGTNYLAADTLQDTDLDGISNRDELRAHTDARSSDAQTRLDRAYRYEQVDEGVRPVLGFTQPRLITGVTVRGVSPATGTGAGTLRFTPRAGGKGPTLAWKDYADGGPGGDFGPAVEITRPRRAGYRLLSCRRGTGGRCTAESALRYITVAVEGEASYPRRAITERIVISSAMRDCLRFTVRNISLVETLRDPQLGTPGNNTIEIYLAEVPRGARAGHAIFRVGSVLLNYREGPPARRRPATATISLEDEDFLLDIKR